MFDKRIDNYTKALVIGTGGGNDIVSTLIPAQHLQKQGIKTDIAGILSPAATHRYNNNLEQVVNVVGENVTRTIPSPNECEISFVDALLPNILQKSNLEIDTIYNFSTRFGTSRLVEKVSELISRKGYDLVVAVDVGGDILARGTDDKHLLSPLMDFTSLYLIGQISTDVLLLEFGLGTDGELRPLGMKQILNDLRHDDLMLYESSISAKDNEVVLFREVFNEVKKTRAGNTAVMTLETLDAKFTEDITTQYTIRSQINKQKWHTPFEVVLPHRYTGKTYLIDGKKLAQKRTQTAFAHENILHQYVKLKNICPNWKTEIDLFYLWSEDNWTSSNSSGQSLFLLTPSTNIPLNQREDIIKYGLQHSNSDLILLWDFDKKHIDNDKFYVSKAGKFILLSKSYMDIIPKTVNQIKQYQL